MTLAGRNVLIIWKGRNFNQGRVILFCSVQTVLIVQELLILLEDSWRVIVAFGHTNVSALDQ